MTQYIQVNTILPYNEINNNDKYTQHFRNQQFIAKQKFSF